MTIQEAWKKCVEDDSFEPQKVLAIGYHAGHDSRDADFKALQERTDKAEAACAEQYKLICDLRLAFSKEPEMQGSKFKDLGMQVVEAVTARDPGAVLLAERDELKRQLAEEKREAFKEEFQSRARRSPVQVGRRMSKFIVQVQVALKADNWKQARSYVAAFIETWDRDAEESRIEGVGGCDGEVSVIESKD